jgi:Tol biopolymer transport system component
VRDRAINTTTLVSRADGPTGAGGDDRSREASISADGRLVAFESLANNLSREDRDGTDDIFVRDLATSRTTLVSRAPGALGAAGDLRSVEASISANGRAVVFTSLANNLSGDDRDGTFDVFVRNLVTNTTTLASRAAGAAGAGGDDLSFEPSITRDGRLVAFASLARNLSGEDADTTFDVFVRDLVTNTTTLVSRAAGAAGAAGDRDSFRPSISAGGRFVAFDSLGNNLSGEDADGTADVFVRDVLGPPTSGAGPAVASGSSAVATASR